MDSHLGMEILEGIGSIADGAARTCRESKSRNCSMPML